MNYANAREKYFEDYVEFEHNILDFIDKITKLYILTNEEMIKEDLKKKNINIENYDMDSSRKAMLEQVINIHKKSISDLIEEISHNHIYASAIQSLGLKVNSLRLQKNRKNDLSHKHKSKIVPTSYVNDFENIKVINLILRQFIREDF